jgi:hypothetical protein
MDVYASLDQEACRRPSRRVLSLAIAIVPDAIQQQL